MTLEEVLTVLGQPTKVVQHGKKIEWEDGVLNLDVKGKKGFSYLARKDLGLRLFFTKNILTSLYVTRTED